MRRLTWNLMPVDPNSVELGIAVEESAELKERVWAVFNSRDHAAWGKRSLLHVSVEVLRVTVQHQLAEFVQLNNTLISKGSDLLGWRSYREFSLWPHLRDIERVESKLVRISLVRLHDLDMCSPGYLFAVLNGIPELTLRVIRIFTAESHCFVGSELFLAVVGEEVIFDVHKFAILVDPVT
jgi:hypothetical protein